MGPKKTKQKRQFPQNVDKFWVLLWATLKKCLGLLGKRRGIQLAAPGINKPLHNSFPAVSMFMFKWLQQFQLTGRAPCLKPSRSSRLFETANELKVARTRHLFSGRPTYGLRSPVVQVIGVNSINQVASGKPSQIRYHSENPTGAFCVYQTKNTKQMYPNVVSPIYPPKLAKQTAKRHIKTPWPRWTIRIRMTHWR